MDAMRSERFPLRRREVAKALLAERGEMLVVAGLGSTAWDVTAAGDHPLSFPLWGAMGGAVVIGLGLALAQPARRVLVLTGDGDMLMGLGSLATVAVQRPANLAIVVFDNERYGETGMQPTHTAHGVDLAAMARAAGIAVAGTVQDQTELEAALPAIRAAPGPLFYAIKVRAEPLPFALPPKDGAFLKDRFRAALLGA
ncbi:MAG TPA: thiamine pyrophosphate-dependent enzyme [Geminicoccaceae bacterium]|nr:thiamine pyrophosphate-dependent enzyme [Geminicoccaceae bacterium]